MANVRTLRSGWVEAGLRALGDGGPDAVRVEPLAQALGVTKGGFYWHFKDRGTFLAELLDAWERAMVDEVIEGVDSGGGDARAKLRRLFAMAADVGPFLKVDLAVRDWSRRDAAVAARLRRVDNRRVAYLRSLFGDFCDGEDEVEARCMVAMALFVGSPGVAAEHGRRTRADVIGLVLERLLA